MRSVVSVLAGYLIFAISAVGLFRISGHDLHAPASVLFLVPGTLYAMFFAAVGGFVAAFLAKRLEFEHSFAVATLITMTGAFSLLAEVGKGPIWTQLVLLLIVAPMAMAGADFRLRQTGHRGIFKARARSRHRQPS